MYVRVAVRPRRRKDPRAQEEGELGIQQVDVASRERVYWEPIGTRPIADIYAWMSKEEFRPKKRAVFRIKIYEAQRQWEKKKTRIPLEQLGSRNESKSKCRSGRSVISYHHHKGFLLRLLPRSPPLLSW